MGKARVYVLLAAGALVMLAAIGVAHLASRGSDAVQRNTQNATPGQTSPQPEPQSTPAAREQVPQEPTLAIVDVNSTRRRLRDGSTLVTARIGVAPRRDAEKGEVEIRVFFFDVTRDGELRPTQAEVAYEWLTPVRDWSDPSPKYLEATYLRPRRARRGGERLRYGGVVVRVYSDGQIQDEQAEPKAILAALRANPDAPARTAAAAAPSGASMMPPPTPASEGDESPTPEPDRGRSVEGAIAAATATQTPTPSTTTSTAPYGKPAPGKPGFVYSPHDEKFIIDVRGVPPGTEIIDPNTGKPLRVP